MPKSNIKPSQTKRSLENDILQRLNQKFVWAFQSLGIQSNPAAIDRMARLIHNGMALRTRTFHTPNHIFEVSENAGPLGTLAAFFHDLVYFNVDDEFPEDIWNRISPYVTTQKTELHITPAGFVNDPKASLILEIFGLDETKTLASFPGPNEFLSSLVAVSELKNFLSEPQLAAIVCCIEATIPFRNPDPEGLMPSEALAVRLRTINRTRKWKLSDNDMDEIMRMAVDLGNRDIDNFAIDDPGLFLDNTWKLMPETNPHLRTPDLYTVRDYRIALQRMESFLCTLNPKSVFHTYKDHPSKATIDEWNRLTTNNIETTLTYIRAKLATIGILEALAELTGGNIPMCYFMGELSTKNKNAVKLEDHLPARKSWKVAKDVNSVCATLLEKGRNTEIWFDLRNAPIAGFVYLYLGNLPLLDMLRITKKFFDKHLSPESFLREVDPYLVSHIAYACSKAAKTRGPSLEKIAEDFGWDARKTG